VWGSNNQSRSFLHARDFARGLLLTAELHPAAEALNIGAEEETRIAELVQMLSDIHQARSGEGSAIAFDTTKEEGQPRRRCDGTLARELLGFEAQVPLAEGLAETVEWYVNQGCR
jgi:nucleoside-diphosphate-sugar epimerase